MRTFRVTTNSTEAQRAFDEGLTLTYAFNHGAAERAYRRAAELDPDCAMAWWGVALVNGPHINFPMVPPDKAAVAWDALGKAQALAPRASARERALISALSRRYAEQEAEDRRPLDEAYAAAMREVYDAYPDDVDVVTLYAEALMDLWPWDLWDLEGEPQPDTLEIVALLERAMTLDPYHPGATHYYVHAIEASPQPVRAEAAADRLRDTASHLSPAAAHLVHMPSHIYIHASRWEDAAEANRAAMASNKAYRAENPRPGFFALYMTHNEHFFAYAQMMRGRSEEALEAARAMVAAIPDEFLNEYAFVADGFVIFPSKVLMRFGRWEEMLEEPQPPENLPLSRALWHFTRGIALAALGRMEQADEERALFIQARDQVPDEWTFGNNSAADILAVATGVLDGEIAAQRGEFETAERHLRQAAAKQDRLRYDEPPDWIQPVRHTLGAVLLMAGKHAEAEQVYREDLEQHPGNGWALYGLSRALRLQQRDAEAAMAERNYQQAWKDADIPMQSSCLCLVGV